MWCRHVSFRCWIVWQTQHVVMLECYKASSAEITFRVERWNINWEPKHHCTMGRVPHVCVIAAEYTEVKQKISRRETTTKEQNQPPPILHHQTQRPKTSVWASHWLVAPRAFYGQFFFLVYSFLRF